jgi:hypothetical protein
MRAELPVFVSLAACASAGGLRSSAALELRSVPRAAIAVVKIKPPWYAPRWLIVRKFRQAVPQYQALDGLERKQFSFAQNGDYGGVYLWSRRSAAEAWFGPDWHARIKSQRGVDADVRLIDVSEGLDGPGERPVFEGPMVVAITSDALERYRAAAGLIAAYSGDGLVVSAWADRASADALLLGREGVEWFDTPVGLQNNPR